MRRKSLLYDRGLVIPRSSVEPSPSPLDGFTDATTLKGGYVNGDWITREATENGSSEYRDRCGKSRLNGITLPSSNWTDPVMVGSLATIVNCFTLKSFEGSKRSR